MRVYFVGSHSTGKTTLCRYVSERYSMKMVTEVARNVLAERETNLKDLRSNIAQVNSFQQEVFARQVAAERMLKDEFVSDRSFDNLAYAAEHTTILHEVVKSKEFLEYVEWVRAGLVFFVRPHKDLVAVDGTREISAVSAWEDIVRIDGMVKLLLEFTGIEYFPLESPLMQERVRAIDYLLRNHTKKEVVVPITRRREPEISEREGSDVK